VAQGIQDKYAAQGFQLITQDDGGRVPDVEELGAWADEYDLTTIPVLQVPAGYQWFPTGLYYRYEVDRYIPTFVHLGPDMTVLSVDEMIADPGSFLG